MFSHLSLAAVTLLCHLIIPQALGAVLPNPNEEKPLADEEQNGLTQDIPGEPFNPDEFDIARELAPSNHAGGSKVYENEHQFEQGLLLRNGLTAENSRWAKVNGYAVIPYIISSKFSSNERLKIVKAFDNFHDNTCIRFVPRVNQRDFVHILTNGGCDSDAGRVGGEQTLHLGQDCVYTDIAIHELNHAVGFWHEQNRPDRDSYIYVYLQNVMPANRFNFDKLSPSQVDAYGQKYDTDSIMHYDQYAFSKEYGKLVVMEAKVPNEKMGLATELSKSDIIKINKMYRCSNVVKNKGSKNKNKISDNFFLEYKLNEDCVDTHENCTVFAAANQGESCNTNPWMKVNCRKACFLCGNSCEDTHDSCGHWAVRGKCETNAEYMHIYCPKSCFTCENMINK